MQSKKVVGIHDELADAVEEIASDYENWVNQEMIDATADAGLRLRALVKQYGEEAVKWAAKANGKLDTEIPDTSLADHFDY